MKLPSFIENIYFSGFEREGILSAVFDDTVELDYKKLRSNSNIYTNPLVRMRIHFKEDPGAVTMEGRFGHIPLRVVHPKNAKGEPQDEGEKEVIRTSPLHRGKNTFTIRTEKGDEWELVIYHKTWWRDWTEGLARAVILIVGLNTFVIQGSYIPSASMMNTLMEGDYIWVNKAAYLLQPPSRGDVVVFNFPLDPTRDFIKRLIGLPGDKIEIRNKVLFLNGKPYEELFTLNDFFPREANSAEVFSNTRTEKLPPGFYMVQWPEGLEIKKGTYIGMNPHAKAGDFMDYKDKEKHGPFHIPMNILAAPGDEVSLKSDGIEVAGFQYISGSYKLIELIPFQAANEVNPAENMKEFQVPENSYFVMGDNRDNSQDSRFWGAVDQSQMKGRAFFLYFPLNRMKAIKRKFGAWLDKSS